MLHVLESGDTIRLVTAPLFLATKLEAFFGRGDGDFLASPDLEDIVAVVNGRPELAEEIATAPASVRDYLTTTLADLLSTPGFRESIAAHLPPDAVSQARSRLLLRRPDDLVRNAG